MKTLVDAFKDGTFLIIKNKSKYKSEDKSEDNSILEDMPPKETEEDASKNREKQGKGLKILTPQQMLTRLPISLAQLKAGNNSEKLKNEIVQLLYSLYR